jgi:hypothetical protein
MRPAAARQDGSRRGDSNAGGLGRRLGPGSPRRPAHEGGGRPRVGGAGSALAQGAARSRRDQCRWQATRRAESACRRYLSAQRSASAGRASASAAYGCPSPKSRPADNRLICQLGSGDNPPPMIITLLHLLRLVPFLYGGHHLLYRWRCARHTRVRSGGGRRVVKAPRPGVRRQLDVADVPECHSAGLGGSARAGCCRRRLRQHASRNSGGKQPNEVDRGDGASRESQQQQRGRKSVPEPFPGQLDPEEHGHGIRAIGQTSVAPSSPSVRTQARVIPAAMPGQAIGTDTRQKIWYRESPRVAAACSRRSSTAANAE